MYIGQIIQARVEKLVFQGKGLIRHQGWVIFVDDVAPGEEVQVKIIKKKKSFFIGKLLEIEVASPHRIEPRCPYFGTCGGCQLQHLEYGEQLAVKEGWINEALSHGIQLRARVGIEKASTAWEYRRKITLHFEWANGIFTLGYYAKDNRSLVDVKVCPIFVGEEALILHDVRAYLLRLEGYRGLKGQVTLLKGDQAAEKYLLRFFFAPHIPHGAKEALQAPDYWSSIWLESPYQSVKIKENPFQITPHVFLQNFPEQAFKLYNDIVTHVKPGRRVLDLYCGIGTLTELLGRQAALAVGVESNVEAILLARAKAGKTCSYHAGRVEELLPVLLKDSTFDTVIVNPPRIGISQEVAELLIRMKAPELIYISCDPATLQRDLTTLSKGGYLVEQGRAYDMFPQTTHLETVVYLSYNN